MICIAFPSISASFKPFTNDRWIAKHELILSEPPLKIDALPAFNDKAPASAVTLGLLSKMMPITPRGDWSLSD